MKKTYLGSKSSSFATSNTLDADLRKYQQDTGQDYYYDRQQFENERNSYDDDGIIGSVVSHFADNISGTIAGAAIGGGVGSVFGPIGAAIGGVTGGVSGSFTNSEDIPNALRGIANRWTEGKISADKYNLGDISRENEDLAKIKDYINLVEQYKTEQNDEEAANILEKIKEYDEYFMGEGRSHAPIAQLMFDANRIPDEYKTGARLAEYSEYLKSGRSNVQGIDKKSGLSGILDNVGVALSDVTNIFANAISTVTNSVSYLENKINSPKYVTNRALMSSAGKKDDLMSPYIKMMYRGGNNAKDIQPELDSWIEYNNNKYKEIDWDLKANEWARINGMARIPFTRHIEQMWENPSKLLNLVPFVDSEGWSNQGGAWVNIWDPQDMSEEWQNAQKQHSGQFWHPLYMLPELGSTLGLAQGMVYTMGLNTVSQYILDKLPTVAANVLGKSKSIKHGAKALQYVSKAIASPYTATAVRSAEIGGTFGILGWQREIETQQEAEEGVSSRLLNLAFSDGSGVNAQKVMKSIVDYVQNNLDIDTSKLEPQDLIGYAIAYNIDTGDPVFENAKEKATDGLNKLLNANNALALHDYIETIPWLSYGGAVMNKFSKMIYDNMSKYYIPIVPTYKNGGWLQSPNKLWNDIRQNWQQELKARSLRNLNPNPVINKLAKEYSDAMYVARNSVLDRIAGQFIANDKIIKGLTIKHVGDHLKNLAKNSIVTGIVEGLEEGQQQVLQQRFQSGEYDDYSNPYSIFNIPESLQNIEVGKHAIEALFGMHDHGDDEIRKAMAIGFFISPLMGGMVNIASNVSSSEQYDNLRNLVGQLRTDRVLGHMIGDNFKEIGDYEHMSLFYDALNKNNVKISKLIKSLNDLKLGVDENNSLVEKKYIDDDIRSAIAINTLYNNDHFKKALKDDGIQEGTDLYKNAIIQNAKVLVDVEDELRAFIDKKSDKIKYMLHIKDSVSKLNDTSVSEEVKQQIRDNDPEIVQTLAQINQFYEKYQQAINDWKSDTRESRKTGLTTLTNAQLASLTHPDPNKGTWLSALLDTPTTVQAGEALLDSDQQFKEEFIDYLLNQDPILPKDRFVDMILTMWEINQVLNRAKQIRNDITAHRDNHLLKFRKLTGKDIDIFKINGYIDSIDDIIDEQTQLSEKYIKWLERVYNYDRKGVLQRTATLDDFFSGEMELPLQEDEYFSNLIGEEIMHNAAFDNLNILRNAILNLESTTPQQLSNVINGIDNTDPVFKDLVEQYKKLEEEEKLDLLDRRQGIDINAEKQQIRRKAALEYILRNAKDKEKRMYIAHQGIISDEIDNISTEENDDLAIEEKEQIVQQDGEKSEEQPQAQPDENKSSVVKEENKPESGQDPQEQQSDSGEENNGEEEQDSNTGEEEQPEETNPSGEDYAPDTTPKGDDEDLNDVGTYQDDYEDVYIDEQEEDPFRNDANTETGSQSRNDSNEEQNSGRNDAEQEDSKDNYRNDVPNDFQDNIDFEFLDYLNDVWVYNGEEMDSKRITPLLAMQQHLVNLNSGQSLYGYDSPGRSHNANDIQMMSDLGYSKDLLSSTFFYDPDPKDKEGNEDNTPTILKNKGVDLKLKYKLGTSRQLAKRLLDKGFFENAKKYYVIATRQEVDAFIKNNPDTTEQNKKDLYTVALVIEDEENKLSYAAFLRDLGRFETEAPTTNRITNEVIISKDTGQPITHMRPVDQEEIRRQEYEQHGIRRAGEKSAAVAAKINSRAANKLAAMWELTFNKKLNKEDALNYVQFKYTLEKDPTESEDQYNKRVQDVRSAILQARQMAREELRIKGKKILTYAEIDYMIDKLRNNRNIIIDAYLSKASRANLQPGEVITSVTPNIAKISNGRFDNITRGVGNNMFVPILRSIARPGNPFGIGTDVAQLSKQIFDGIVRLGYGTGQYFTNMPFNIIDIRSDHQESQYTKGGIAGKIFLSVDTVNGTKVPMMLIEQKLNTQHAKNGNVSYIQQDNDVVLTIDPNTGKITNDDYNPSIAEMLLYMLFGKLSSEYIPGDSSFSKDTQQQFANLIVNNGVKTLLKNQNVEKMLPYYAAKQLAVIDGVLHIGMPILDKDGIPTGQYTRQKYTESEIFSDSAKRQHIVATIAQQMHWNTERFVMERKFGDAGTDLIINSLKSYFEDNKAEDISICGIPELTFKKNDIFEVGRTGKPTRVIPNTMVAAWMIINEKLTSDVSDDVFYAPFVFASGVAEDAVGLGDNNDQIDIQQVLNDTHVLQSIQSYNPTAADFYVSDDKYKEAVSNVDVAKNSAIYKQHGARIKTVLFDMSSYRSEKYSNKEDFIKDVKEKANKLIQTIKDDKTLNLREGSVLTLSDKIRKKALAENAMNSANGDKDLKKAIPVVDIYEDGTVEISFFSYSGIGEASQQFVNGIFSTTNQLAALDEDRAREWLNKTLGIERRNVLVTDAALKSLVNDKVYDDVYGMMEVIYDNLTEKNEAKFAFRRNGAKDLEFHEAWHYVNLLINDEKTRQRLWEEFARNKGLDGKGLQYKDIEEEMADDYKAWQRNQLDHPISSKIKRFFRTVGELLRIVKNRPLYEKVYYDIHRGQFKNAKLDARSVLAFKKRYGGVVFRLDVLGLNKSSAEKMAPVIKNTGTFYKVSDAIVDYALYMFDITTVDKLKHLVKKEGFAEFKEELEDLRDTLDEQKAALLQAFIDCPDAILHALHSRFKDLGIDVRIKPEHRKDAHTAEKSTEPAFDRYQFSVSKKTHAGFLTKLFMRQIPKSHWEIGNDGKENYVEEENDFIDGVKQYVPFDQAWNLITKNLYKCSSYDDVILDRDDNPVLDEHGHVIYKPTSLRGLIKDLAESQAFFAALDQKMDAIDGNALLKAQVYSTINSQLPNMSYMRLSTQIKTQKAMDELAELGQELPQEEIDAVLKKQNEKLLADRTKKWELRNDNTLRAARNIPRLWSKSILLRGLVKNTTNGPVVSKEYANLLLGMQRNLNTKTKDSNSDLNEVKKDAVTLLKKMGIPCDIQILDYFLQLDFTRSGELFNKDTIKDHINKMMCQKTAGSIGYFISLIANNTNKSQFVNGVGEKQLKEPISLDRMFVGTKLSSKISKLALAQNAVHPSTEEYAVRMPNGEMGYPNSQNNTVSTETRLMNDTDGQRAMEKMDDPYCEHSLMCGVAKDFDSMTPDQNKFVLNLHVGMSSDSSQDGVDYFGITALEDYLINMYLLDQDPTFGVSKDDLKKGITNNEFTHLITPTMADKKTHYDIQSKQLRTVHDTVVWYMTDDMLKSYVAKKYKNDFDAQFRKDHPGVEEGFEFANKYYEPSWDEFVQDAIKSIKDNNYHDLTNDPDFYFRTYSNKTLKIFTNYFKDELKALQQYYSKDHINTLKNDPNKRVDNFHGTFKDGRMQFDGNGGLFRYFYDIFAVVDGHMVVKPYVEDESYSQSPNLNQWLESLWNIQKQIEEGQIVDSKTGQSVGLSDIDSKLNLKNVDDVDGFELIRVKLDQLYDRLFEGGVASQKLKSAINNKLLRLTQLELHDVSTNTNRQLSIEYDGVYYPYAVPSMFLQRQNQRFYDNKHSLGRKSYTPYSGKLSINDAQMFFSLMANHVANTAISIIEYEKVYSGDPSQYKYKYAKDNETGNYVKQKDNYVVTLGNKQIQTEVETRLLEDKSTDKIKRLGSQQSPGDEIFTGYSEKDVPDQNERNYLNSKHYTNLTIRDFILKSSVLDSEIKPRFRRQLIVDYLRTNRIKEIHDLIKKKQAALKDKDAVYTFEHLVQDIYTNNHGVEDEVIEILKNLNAYSKIESEVKGQSKPFGKTNVSDAQVLLRPAFYRKIRKGLGLWRDDIEEVAYQIIENDPKWMEKPELIEKVSQAEFYPLKMSYFSTESYEVSPGKFINRTILNKQACFPLFKHHAQSDTGRDLYKRMNMPGNEIDQLSFESAVKVGSSQNSPYAYSENENGGKVTTIGSLGDWIDKKSASHINFEKDKEESGASGDTLPVVVQNLTFLRYQLNTESHKDDYRAIGTQVFKIMFQNLFDKAVYGQNAPYGNSMRGEHLKTDILACIDALTQKGVDNLHKDYYIKDPNTGRFIPSDSAIQKYINNIVLNQNLGIVAETIINNGGVAECLTNRTIFEQNAVAKINENVIDINTQGGTAIQQSMFGFNDYTDNSVGWDGSFVKYNDGKPLRWHREDGSIEVMLSLNFFRNVIPDYESKTQDQRRDWLFENGVIGRDSKPFGIAYRIPTQGLSSSFSITVVDVLSNVDGDLVVLPAEITAQTGSDYDVDKMFIATLNYEDGKLIDVPPIDNKLPLSKKREFYKNLTEKQIQNKLLFDYLSIITDVKSYAGSRKSIDTIVDTLKHGFLDKIEPKTSKYVLGMQELLPSFQSDRKLEFKTGKDGIGPFALSITNLTLMQAVHLTMMYNDSLSEYGFLDLDSIYSKDGSYIQDWLSAMVSAHVDVAKDPYIFKLNVNKVTYNHTSFLLRSGMGISTFSFLAQPILKKYASLVMQAGGVYGKMLTGSEVVNTSRSKRAKQIKNQLYGEYINKIKILLDRAKDTDDESTIQDIYKKALTYNKYTGKNNVFVSDDKKAKEFINRQEIFDFDKGVSSIKNASNSASIKDQAESALFNLQCLFAFDEISKPADALSEIILQSRIDTEGFGNTIVTQYNFDSKLKALKYQGNSRWQIKGASPELNSTPGYALKIYFEHTYLENKFYTAHLMTVQMLRRQLLSATTPYKKIFDGVGRLLNGESTLHKIQYIKDPNTGRWVPKVKKNPKDGTTQYIEDTEKIFKAFYNDKSAQAVGNAIDNIARFNILMNYYKYVETPQQNHKQISDLEHGVPVDLSMGGDINKVLYKIRTLVLGSQDVKSLPMRFNDLFQDIQDNPYADYAEGLVNGDGVSNEFLRFIQPIAKNPAKNQNIDYFTLNESVIRSSDYHKQHVISDFGVLLNHPSDRVRELAEDLVFYAYYTSYDTPGRNKFFSLVPPYYRSLYDDIIKQALVGSNRENQFVMFSTPYKRTQYASELAEDYVDLIARNYWYDDTIVSRTYENTNLNKEDASAKSSKYEYRPNEFYWTNKENKQKYPGLIITNNLDVKQNPAFVKIEKSGYTVLYKNMGKLQIKKLTTNKDGVTDYSAYISPTIYIAVEKAGTWSNGTYLPEFYKTSQIPSIYAENKLPGNFHEGKIWEFLDKFVERKNKQVSNKPNTFKYEIIRTVPKLDLDDKNLDIYYQSVYSGYVPEAQKKVMKTIDGSTKVEVEKRATSTTVNYATNIISVSSDKYNGEVIPGSKRLDIQDVFDDSGNINIESVLSQIESIVSNMSQDDKLRKNRIIINIIEESVPASQKEEQRYIDYAETWYLQQNPDAEDVEVEQYVDFIKSIANDQIKLVKMYQLSDLIIKALTLNGYNINLIMASRLTQLSRATLTAAKDNSDIIGDPISVQKGLLRVTPTDIRTTYDTFMDTLNAGIQAYRLDIPGVDYQSQAHSDISELAADAEQQVEQKKDNTRKASSSQADISKMTPEEIEEYVKQQMSGYNNNSKSQKPDESLQQKQEQGQQKPSAQQNQKVNIDKMTPEEIEQYVKSQMNSFVNENGNKPNNC